MGKYDGLTEEQLVISFQQGDKTAGEALLERYKKTVLSIARRSFLVDGDADDLSQEGMCGLYSAMVGYKGGSEFAAYAYACIKNRILDAVKKSCSLKNAALNTSSPINEADGKSAPSSNPEDALLYDENLYETAQKMRANLSPLEYDVFKMYCLDGATMAEITSSLNINYKQADNALSRAKKKLKALYKNNQP